MSTANEFDWNLATVWETVAEELPEAPAQTQGDRTYTWARFDRRADGIARTLLDNKASRDDRVAQYLRNSPEYLEVAHAAFKIGIPAVNTNYRYRDEELRYLWDNADVTSVVFHGAFTPVVNALRGELPKIRTFIHVDDGTLGCPDWAVPYEQAAGSSPGRVRSPWGRGGDDLFLMYTGGTTGMPKGVMWRAVDMLQQNNDVSPVTYDLAEGVEAIRRALTGPGPAHISGSPYMHGTGYFGALMAMHGGGHVISLAAPGFDAEEFLDEIDRFAVSSVAISGEVFARRVAKALETQPLRWRSGTVRNVLSSGGMLGEQSKRTLLDHWPDAMILDGFSASEGFGMGWSVATKDNVPETGRFSAGPNVRVLDENDLPVEPGSGVIGRLVVRNRVPVGYYKDADKSAATFRMIDGVRTAVPGDRAVIHDDGTVQLMGRDSLCITSGGEKIFTEEVEGVVLDHPAVTDVLVIGVPDPEWGELVAAVISLEEGRRVTTDEIRDHVKARLAGYKAPRLVTVVDVVPRSPNGKADYPAARALAEARRRPA